jgi:hypothetical protein
MSVAGAELLNDKWEALSDRFNLLKSVPKAEGRLINAAIAQWQDWYWDKYESWPSTQLLGWQDRYVKTARLLDALAVKTVVVKSVKQTDSYQAPKPVAIKLPPLLITAKPPTPPPKLASMAAVDTSGWASTDYGAVKPWELDTGGGFVLPTDTGVAMDRKGLWAVMAAVGAAIWGKRSGWL